MITLNFAGLFQNCFSTTKKKDRGSTEQQKQELFSKITHYLSEFSDEIQNKERIRFILQEILNCYRCNTICVNLLDPKGNLSVYLSIGIKQLTSKEFNVNCHPIYKQGNLVGVLLFGQNKNIHPDVNLVNIIDILGSLL